MTIRHRAFVWFSSTEGFAFRQAATAARSFCSESLRERMFPPATEAKQSDSNYKTSPSWHLFSDDFVSRSGDGPVAQLVRAHA